jgi:hypothetical protein
MPVAYNVTRVLRTGPKMVRGQIQGILSHGQKAGFHHAVRFSILKVAILNMLFPGEDSMNDPHFVRFY